MHVDNFGKFEFSDVEILFDPAVNEITPLTFNQNDNEYYIDDVEIARLSLLSANRFYDNRAKEIILGINPLTTLELKGIKDFFGVSGSDLGELIGFNKSSVSRILRGEQPIMPDTAKSLINLLKQELISPGYSRIVLFNYKSYCPVGVPKLLNISLEEIAEYFIRKFDERESPITHLKLQKLIYYSLGIGFGRYDVKLFDEPLFAWQHGPVAKTIYDMFSDNGKNPLDSNPHIDLSKIISDETVYNILEETIAIYGIYDAWILREMTHNEAPWVETPRNSVITDEKMTAFFKRVVF